VQTISLGYGIGTRSYRYGWSAPRRVSSTFVPPKRTVARKPVQFRQSRYGRYAQFTRGRATRTRAEVQAQGQRLLAEARARSAAGIARKKAQREAARAARAARSRRIAAKSPPANTKAGVSAWQAYYQRIGKQIPQAALETIQRGEKKTLMKAVRSKFWVSREAAALSRVGRRPGISWMFAVAYGGDMPYWDDWYNKTMTAEQIARRVAADYEAEIRRRVVVQEQNVRRREAWQDTGKVGPKPQPSTVLLPEQAAPAAQPVQRRKAGPPAIAFDKPAPAQRAPGKPPPINF